MILAGCQGRGELSLRIVEAATGRVVFRNQPRRVQFTGQAEDTIGITFRVRNCSFPAEGVYWVELIFSGVIIARQSFRVTD